MFSDSPLAGVFGNAKKKKNCDNILATKSQSEW